jgi:hypothetical protein
VRQYEIWKQGVRPRKGEVLGEDTPALWRNSRFEGKGGAGDDEGEGERERESGENGEEYVVRGVGRLPDDKTMRPSTLAGYVESSQNPPSCSRRELGPEPRHATLGARRLAELIDPCPVAS